MNNKSFVSVAVVALLSVFATSASCLADAPSTQPTYHAFPVGGRRAHNEEELISMQLVDPDDAVRAKALARAWELADAGLQVNGWWLEALSNQGQFDDLDALATQGIINWPEQSDQVAGFQRYRAVALKSAGKKEAALGAAKAYYNVCPLTQTEAAITLLQDCLADARPDDASVSTRLASQQVAWSSAPADPPAANSPDKSADASLGDNVLKSITVDGKLFADFAAQIPARDFNGLMGRGNLLLLADDAAGARKAFEAALSLAKKKSDQSTPAIEGIARSIRAASDCLGPANAYVLSMRTQQKK